MYNGGKIFFGIIVFLGIFTFPVYYNIGKADTTPKPSLNTPVINQMKVKHCVEPKAFMRANHMQLLNEWRDSALRQGQRDYVSSTGETYNISLQNTCLHCHSNKEKFCDRCHNYMAVHPYCWSCHFAPGKENKL
ncbi:MAG: sulfate reduction electron transfer complex DsrMKJOP subunit DsrJ [Nitrospiraceae bacterium]|nr:sulfate reduction electron transfer complex DsrMKJOP subunit DsrJ [Nitrospiraceae bacterium]